MSVVEVLEVLSEHLVGVLGEDLPGLEEGREVLHLPPEVKRLVVDSGECLVLVVSGDRVVLDRRGVHHVAVGSRVHVEEGVDRAGDGNGSGASLLANVLGIGEVLLDEGVGIGAGFNFTEHLSHRLG